MSDYNALKVPDLKKLLGERGLMISGNKADLIARLQQDDIKKNEGAAASGAAEDEIDWDEDDNKVEPATTAAPVAPAPEIKTPAAAAPSPKPAEPVAAPTTTTTTESAPAPAPTTTATTTEPAPAPEVKPEEPKKNFTAGLVLSEAEKEAAKRAARAKRFGMDKKAEATQTDEEKKLAERAKKFGTDKTKDEGIIKSIVSTLNDGLSEKRMKRGREDRGEGGRHAKRQTPDRRTEGQRRDGRGGGGGQRGEGRGGGGSGGFKKITDDPVEAAKAEARAKRFAAAK
ncbi:uncharacterized protein L3040_000966 [Drepanopeziza brunnea f. sp. 'multigermtubi']|uniref:SAP domain-containing protein n=1 Tax=Marssonina brunnea f. sp. multigermtubi (strain MB_m1) TaxID=1072389 RepID=K1Y6N7_MARBU|nr:SAP domain-containing protein [Drepanopeziza brunnea f. sp. 'multigermtubi' MB_m1]EKD20864.1 SAP domain-containing protein [Drepanopeziza brunnea f. sp. 'multigermtubi' MB_m1]KAJ5054700.1 hypothetical protein L3040_000966 [Drepanopeziza brunnea f. sp. 'multigermtubi']